MSRSLLRIARTAPRWRLPVLLLLLAALPALAQRPAAARDRPGPQVLAYTLEHQPAAEALVLVRGMLSPMGTVELQPGSNTLVMRDHGAVLARVATALGSFDHPPRTLRFDIHLLRASDRPGPGSAPEAIVGRLRDHLRWKSYEQLAQVEISSREGETVTYALGSRYGVSFRPGALVEETLRLNRFRIVRKPPISPRTTNKSRQPEPRELIRTDLNLWREKQFTLVLSEGGGNAQALAVVIIFRPEEAQ